MNKKWASLIGKTGFSILLLFAGVIVSNIALQFVPVPEIGMLATPMGLALSAWLMYVWFDKKQGWSLGWRDEKGTGRFFVGGAAAAGVISLAVSLILMTGTVDVAPNSWSLLAVAGQTFLFLSVAAGEEWLFRGYLFGLYQKAVGVRTAVLGNTMLFTAIHLLNPESLSRPPVHIAVEMANIFLMGMLMSQARVMTGSLWMPIGLHFLLNFVQSSVFGFTNGGKEVPSFFELSYHEVTLWNGASHGLESSLALTPVLLAAVVFVARMMNRKAHRVSGGGAGAKRTAEVQG
ncbi:CPBP family intramembrane metalloprotease [Paenibacillus sp. TRM 82003]|nr:CPBP family intramembrane metalloprotease [Paenibacillus sp. TRM 82003]